MSYRGGGRGNHGSSSSRDGRGGRGGGRGNGFRHDFFQRNVSDARKALVDTAKETKTALPFILKELPHIHADESEVWSLDALPALQPSACPRHPKKAVIKVVNEDTFNAAIQLAGTQPGPDTAAATPAAAAAAPSSSSRVALLNLASHSNPGGGWLSGAMAQEEALCYRSSLALSLHKRYYPLAPLQGIYTPDVVVIRSAQSAGHGLLAPAVQPADLPVVSVISIAAIRRPEIRNLVTRVPLKEDDDDDNNNDDNQEEEKEKEKEKQGSKADDDSQKDKQSGGGSGGGATYTKKPQFAKQQDRDLTKDKMRLTLRMAASKGHDLLVLGALGCGAFRNPTEDVADCWVEVLREPEFAGGWWREVWFAVYDRRQEGNFEVFEAALGGMEV